MGMNFQPTSITVTELYNLINQIGASSNSALVDGSFLIIFDCRTYHKWEESHILMADTVPRDENNVMRKPVKSLGQFEHIVVYDEGNVLDNDEASANNFAKLFTYHDARNPVRILDGGFIHFSKKYSFLRSAEMAHTPRQLAAMITPMPMEIDSKLFVSCKKHATPLNVKLLQISAVINCDDAIDPPCTNCLNINVLDDETINAALQFISNNERILVVCRNGRKMSAVLAIIYRMKHKLESFKTAESNVRHVIANIFTGGRYRRQLSALEVKQ